MDNEDSEDETLKLNFAVAGHNPNGGSSDTDLDHLKYENPTNDTGAAARAQRDTRIDYNMSVRTHAGALPKTGFKKFILNFILISSILLNCYQ